MRPSVPALPPALHTVLQPFRFLFHADTWPVFLCVFTGLLTGHTTLACVRASLLTASVKWHQCCDFYRRARWSRTAFLRATTGLVLRTLYPAGLPARLWWVVDTTTSDKPSARSVFGIRRFWRGCRRPGQAPTHRGHGWLLLAHLHQRPDRSWQALLVGALLWLQLRCAPPGRLATTLVAQLGLPPQATHVVVSDRGLSSRQLVRDLRARGCHSVTRLRRNTVVYTAAPRPDRPGPGRPRKYGDKYRLDALDRRLLTATAVTVWVDQRWQAATAWRGTFWRKGLPEPVEIILVETAKRAPWYLQATDPTLTTAEIVAGYHGRHAIEPAIQQANALGLDRYHGRTARGVRRWPLPICLAHSLLALGALGALPLDLPELGWPWYPREDTVGQVRRRFLAALAQDGVFVPEGGLGQIPPKTRRAA
jgi:DDE superfamily endonuclease